MMRLAFFVPLLVGCLDLNTGEVHGDCTLPSYECRDGAARNCVGKSPEYTGGTGGFPVASDVETSWNTRVCDSGKVCVADDERKHALCALSAVPNPACTSASHCEGHFLVVCDGRFEIKREDCGECATLSFRDPRMYSIIPLETLTLRVIRKSKCDGSVTEPKDAVFESLDPRVATVTADGVVTGWREGQTTIRATAGTLKTEINVYVRAR
jgi:hypothetical protein